MVITTYISTQKMNDKLPSLERHSKLNFHQNISNYYDDMNYRRRSGNFQFDGNPFCKNARGIG